MDKKTKLEEKKLTLIYDRIIDILKMDKLDAISEIDDMFYNLVEQRYLNVYDDDEYEYEEEDDDSDDGDYENYDEEEDDGSDYDANDFGEKNAKLTIEELVKAIKIDLKISKRKIKNKIYDYSSLRSLERRSEYLTYHLKKNINKLTDDTVNELEELNNAIKKTIKDAILSDNYDEMISLYESEIFSVSSVRSIISRLKENEKIIIEIDRYSKEVKNLSFRIKEKCCKHRAIKKLKDAEICRKNDKLSKATKLELEAQALFEQDWEIIFGNKDYYILKHAL